MGLWIIANTFFLRYFSQREKEFGTVRTFIDFNVRNFVIAIFYNFLAMLIGLFWNDPWVMADSGVMNYFLINWSVQLFSDKQKVT